MSPLDQDHVPKNVRSVFACRPNAVIVTLVAGFDVFLGAEDDGAGVGFGLDGVTVTVSEIFNT